MRNTVGRDFVAILFIYVLYFGLLYGLDASKALTDIFGVTPGVVDGKTLTVDDYRLDFNTWAQVVLIVSLMLAVVWYALGEWGLKAHRVSDGAKLLIWLFLFLLAIVIGILAITFGPPAEYNSHVPALIHILGGAGFFALATILFSPAGCKYVPPLAKQLRRW